MKLGLLSTLICALSIWTAVFAQLPELRETPNAATERAARNQSDYKAKPKITLRVDDFVHLDPVVLADAKQVTMEIFRKAGVETVWLDCPLYRADCGMETERLQFMIRVLAPAMDKEIVAEDALGFAVPCHAPDRGCLLYIFYSRISTLAAEHGVGPGRILGHVMAHEIGHALLGPNAHKFYGIMQARLNIPDLKLTLYFTSAQSMRIRTELMAQNRVANYTTH